MPPNRPEKAVAAAPVIKPPSASSQELSRHYLAIQNDLLARGLLRTDGGGPDTLFSADDLAQNFETIAFFDEYSRGAVVSDTNRNVTGELGRWKSQVRFNTEFGPSVPKDQRATDRASVEKFSKRLAKITGHPISTVSRPNNANFHVFFAGKDDSDFVRKRLKQLIPTISETELDLFANPPRSFYCLVAAVSGARNSRHLTRAVALVRAEHPDLVRLSCVHEELAQGLGLPNDSPEARPSIFNDDDEFALLTTHDEMLLKLLYDKRLKAGMTAEQARPVTRIIARELMGQKL